MASLLFCRPALRNYYFGPGGGMVRLPMPDKGPKTTLDQGRVDHALLGGPHAVQHLGKVRRLLEYDWTARDPDTADLIVSIYAGLLGVGPFYMIDPAWRNLLPGHIAAAGKINATSVGFVVSAGGAVAYTAAIVAPTKAPLCGVQDWTTVQNSFLWLNATAANITEAGACPVNQLEPFTGAMWLRTASGATSVDIYAYFTDAAGASLGTQVLLAGQALSTTWQRFGGGKLAGTAPAGAVTYSLAVKAVSAAPPHIYVSAPDIQQVTATIDPLDAGNPGTTLAPWVHGLGVPQVLANAQLPADAASGYWRRNHVLTLVEAA